MAEEVHPCPEDTPWWKCPVCEPQKENKSMGHTVDYPEPIHPRAQEHTTCERPQADTRVWPEIPEGAGAQAYDQGKPDLTLVPVELMNAAARGLGYGLVKYKRNNFKNRPGLSYTRLGASLLRHIVAWASGEDIDPESGVHHLDLAAARLSMLLYEVNRNNTTGDGGEDNR